MALRTLTAADLKALHTTLVTKFNAGLALSPDDWKMIAKLIPSDGKSNTYAWLTQFPAFREWVGSRLHKAVKEVAYAVDNRKFEATIDVQADDIEDDNFGHYAGIAESYGQAAKDLMNDLVFQKIIDGFSSVCYDGQYFFDTDHPLYPNEDGSGVATQQSNVQLGTGAPWVLLCTKRAASPFYLQQRTPPRLDSMTNPNSSDTTFNYDVYSFGGRWRGDAAFGFWQCAFGSKDDLTPDNFDAAYNAMMAFKGDGGRKLGIKADMLVVGPSNRVAAEALIEKDYLAGGETNTNYKRVQLVVTPWLP